MTFFLNSSLAWPFYTLCFYISPNDIAKKHRLSLVLVGLFSLATNGHWFSCQMGVCHWSPSVAKTDEDQRQPMFFCNIIWAIE